MRLVGLGGIAIVVAILVAGAVWWSFRNTAADALAGAADQTASFYQEELRAFRFNERLLWGPQPMRDFRGGAGSSMVSTVVETVSEGQQVMPDRARMRTRTYYIYEGDVENRFVLPVCSEMILIGTKVYTGDCGGPWQVEDVAQQAEQSGPQTLEGYWEHIRSLVNVTRIGQESVRDVAADVYQGEFVDANSDPHRISVWVGREDNLIRKLKDEWPLYSLEVELYDINDSAIVIEEPQ